MWSLGNVWRSAVRKNGGFEVVNGGRVGLWQCCSFDGAVDPPWDTLLWSSACNKKSWVNQTKPVSEPAWERGLQARKISPAWKMIGLSWSSPSNRKERVRRAPKREGGGGCRRAAEAAHCAGR